MFRANMNKPSDNTNNDSAIVQDYLIRASQACLDGEDVLGLYLYLAAYECAQNSTDPLPEDDLVIEGLKNAWHLACKLGQRSLAEYVFDLLEPSLSPEEMKQCVEQLENLTLDKLEEFGFSRSDLENVSNMIKNDPQIQDLLQGGNTAVLSSLNTHSSSEEKNDIPKKSISIKGVMIPDKIITHNSQSNTSQEQKQASQNAAKAKISLTPSQQKKASEQVLRITPRIRFKDLIGFSSAIEQVKQYGIGMSENKDYTSFIEKLNKEHGLSSAPACESLIFSSDDSDDTSRFMDALVGELNLPIVRMYMDQNMQGLPVLCVLTQADNAPTLSANHNEFEGPAVLVLEDIDMWLAPSIESLPNSPMADIGELIQATLSRGAKEAMSLIRSAVEHPKVYVFATATAIETIDPFFIDVLRPYSILSIPLPNRNERRSIWNNIQSLHPSFKAVNINKLISFSEGFSRFEIYTAARETIEDVYRQSVSSKVIKTISESDICEHLALLCPNGSNEYKKLEDEAVKAFSDTFLVLEEELNEYPSLSSALSVLSSPTATPDTSPSDASEDK